MSLQDPVQNTRLPGGIQKLLNKMYAGQESGFSGPQILDFFSQFSLEIERYNFCGGMPSRKDILEDCLSRFSLEQQRSIIASLLDYDGPMKYPRPGVTDIETIREWVREGKTPIIALNISNQAPSWSYVHQEWKKASDRVSSDSAGAITSARSLLESVCKHILDERDIPFENDGDLQKLYKATAKALILSQEQQAEDIFRQVLAGCATIANGLAGMRNQFGDAHGRSSEDSEAQVRHARLAVNAACTLALFFIETHLAVS